MANSDKNIRIQPNRNSTLFPKITFTGQSNNPITLNVLDDNSISFEGSAGQLFSINNNLSSGYIFSVNDISGLPSFRINADGTVGIAEFYGNVGIGITNPSYKFHARGDSYFSSTGNTALLFLSGTGGTIIASNSVNITLTDPARKGLVIRAATSQSANLLEWFPASGDGGYIRPTGEMVIGNAGTKNMSNGSTALLAIQGRGTTEGMLIRGFNSIASEVLFEVQNNGGAQLFGIYGDGGVNAPRINVTNGTASTSTSAGALIVTGGVGIGGSVNIGSALTVSGTTRLNSSLFNIPPTSSIGGASGSANFGTYWTGYQVENGYLIYGRQVSGGFINIIEPSTGAQVGGTSNIFAEFLKHFKWGKDKYVVLASTGNSVLYSTSPVGAGSSWYYATLPTTASWQRLEYGNNRFVAVATGSTAAYSYDGITWSLASLPSSIAWSDIKYGNGVFVAGAGSTVAYSYDGIDWAIASNNVAALNLTYGNGFFFANATGNTASYSADGINWTNVTLPSDTHRGSAYGNGVFFNVGASSSNYISSDLINWTATANGVGSLSVPNSPWYVNNTFYYNQFAGSIGAFVTGPSGTLDLNPRFTGDINNVEIGGIKPAAAEFTTLAASGPVRFVSGLASTGFRNGSVVITGGVGIGGTLNVNNIGIGYTGIPYSPSIAFIGTTGDPIRLNVLSNNTLSFEGRSGQLFSINNNLSSGWIFSVNDISGIPLFRANADATISMAEYAGNVGIGLSNPTFKFQVAGSASIGGTTNLNTLRVNQDLVFTPSIGTTALAGGLLTANFPSFASAGSSMTRTVAFGNGRFVGAAGTSIIWSEDAINWTRVNNPSTANAPYFIAYGNNTWVATLNSTGTELIYSTNNGNSWSTATIPYASTPTLVFGNGIFVLGSPQYTGISTNGINWSTYTPSYFPDRFINGFFYSQTHRSPDGYNWQALNIPTTNNAISYGNGLYFAPQYNSANYYFSYDGVNFSTTTIGNAVHLNSAYYNGVYYLVTQHNNALLKYSTDGFNYTNVGYPNSSTNYGIAYGNNKIVLFNNLYTEATNYIYYAEASFGKANIQPFREGTIDNVTIGSRIPQAGTFNNVSVLKNLNVNSNFPSVSSNTGALTVLGGVGIGGTLNANSVVTYNRLQNQSFSGTAIGATTYPSSNFGVGHNKTSYGNGVFVSTSSWNTANANYSTDGINWTSVSLPVNQPYPVNFFGNGYFVLAGLASTTILYSTNGQSWSQVSIGNTQSRSWGAYGNGKYVMVGSGATYYYSSNITSWTANTLPYDADWRLAYGNGMFVALAYGSGILVYSYDAINWSISNTAGANHTDLYYGNGKFIVTTWSGWGVKYSVDGINWISVSNPGGSYDGNLLNVKYGNGVYAISDNGGTILSSTDGITWDPGVYKGGGSTYISYGNNRFVGGRWIDGPTNTVTLDPKFTGEINNVRIGAITPASGDFTNLSSTGSANLVGTVNANNLNILSKVNQTPVLGGFAGTDGWTSAALLAGSDNNFALAFGNGLFVQIRKTTNHTSFSSDGKRWIASTMPFTGEWYDLAWGKDKFVAVAGVGTTGAFSGNGISWTSMNMPSNASGWYKITFADEKYVAISSTGSTAAYSFDGISWSTSSMIATTNWKDITYGNGTFIAVSGTGRSAAYSYDGINWNLFNLPSSSGGNTRYITYGNGLFISPAYNTSAVDYSRDGVNWSTINITSGLHLPTVYGNGMYATFNYSNVHYSYDGLTWLVGNTIAATDWFAAEYGNNRFVATSINTVQVGSIDGPSNTLNLYPKFTGDIDNVRIGAKQPAAAEFTNLAAQQPVRFTANTPSTNTTNGALMVLGGVGIGGSLNIGSDVIINGGRESNSTSTGSLIVRGGVGITGGLYVSPFSSTGKGIVVASRASQSGNLFELQNSSLSTITSFNFLGDLNITSSTANTSATTGSIVTSGGVGIGGSVTINSLSQSTSTTNGALKVSGGVGISGNVNVGGSLNFSSSIFGGVSTSIVPTMTFIGQANDPITLSVLSDNSLSFDGSSGQLFSINNNLSTGWIFSISDISGLPLFRTNADGTVSMGEFGGNVGIGLTNPTFKLQVAGRASIGDTLFVTGNAHFGSTAYFDNYQSIYSPVVTITENFPGDTGLQIKNNSTDSNARSGIQIFNDFNESLGLYLGSSNFSGIGVTSTAYLETFRYLEVSAGDGMRFRTGSGDAIIVGGAGVSVSPTTESTSTTTGSLIVSGGAGIAKSVNIGGFLSSKPAYVKSGLASDQTLTAGSDNLILFTKVVPDTDPNVWWTNTGGVGVSHIFKPNIAGLYFVSCQVHFKTGTGSGQMNIQARKNGSTFSISQDVLNTVEGRTLSLTGIVQLNGNTDYVDFSAYTNSSGTPLLTGESNRQYSQAIIYKIF